jgi:hypothetical protein
MEYKVGDIVYLEVLKDALLFRDRMREQFKLEDVKAGDIILGVCLELDGWGNPIRFHPIGDPSNWRPIQKMASCISPLQGD